MDYKNEDFILEVKNLTKFFDTQDGKLHAVDGVSFSVKRGTTLGIVGESGCGKSTTGRTILKLIEPTCGKIFFDGTDITDYSPSRMRKIRPQIQIIFQDPFSSLDPRQSVINLISEPIIQHKICNTRAEAEKRTLELMDTVGIARRFVNSYPHELDGGRRQRVGIARALATNPKLIVCDEPVSSLDVSIQAQILNLLKDLQKDSGLTYVFITHDLSVVRYFSDYICVMYMGQIVEKASSDELFLNPVHPYTKALLSSILLPVVSKDRPVRKLIEGEVASPVNLPDMCRFAARCDLCTEKCRTKCNPELKEISPGHFVACNLL